MNHLNMICRRKHGQWSCGWKYQKESDWCNKAGLYVNNYFGEELLITFSVRHKLVVIFQLSPDPNINLSNPQEIRSYEQLMTWIRSEVPSYNDPDFDDGCWMMSNLNDMGWIIV